MTSTDSVAADLFYIPADAKNPTIQNRAYGQDSLYSYTYEPHRTVIESGRGAEDVFTLDRHGFQIVRWPSVLGGHVRDGDPTIETDYYPEVEVLLKTLTGANDVVIFDHTVRTEDLFDTRKPVRHTHNDYTAASGPLRVRDLLGDVEAEKRFKGRIAQVNLWRPLGSTVQSSPLALADATSVDPDDLRRTALLYEDRSGEIYELSHNPDQRWIYFPRMSPDEALLIKGYDSLEDGRARFTPHTGFDDPTTAHGAPPRRSIEVRAFLFFDPN